MTADIVNLRTARKRKARAERENEAARKRALHGQSKAERELRQAGEALERRRLDQARLDAGRDDEHG